MARQPSIASTSGCFLDRRGAARGRNCGPDCTIDRLEKLRVTEEEIGSDCRPWLISRRYAWLLAAPALFLLVFFLWPLILVVVRSFVDPSLGLSNYSQILASPVHLQVLWNTVTTAAI